MSHAHLHPSQQSVKTTEEQQREYHPQQLAPDDPLNVSQQAKPDQHKHDQQQLQHACKQSLLQVGHKQAVQADKSMDAAQQTEPHLQQLTNLNPHQTADLQQQQQLSDVNFIGSTEQDGQKSIHAIQADKSMDAAQQTEACLQQSTNSDQPAELQQQQKHSKQAQQLPSVGLVGSTEQHVRKSVQAQSSTLSVGQNLSLRQSVKGTCLSSPTSPLNMSCDVHAKSADHIEATLLQQSLAHGHATNRLLSYRLQDDDVDSDGS